MLAMSRFSLRSWLHGLTAAIALPMALLLGWTVYNKYQEDATEAGRASYDIARLTAGNVGNLVGESKAALDTFAKHPRMPIDLHATKLLPAADMLPEATIITIIDGAGTVLSRSTDAWNFVGRNIRNVGMVEAVLARRNGTMRATSLDNTERLYGYVPVPGTDWIVIAGRTADVALASARRAALSSALIGFTILAGVLLLAWYFAKRIAGPILDIRQVAARVADGDWSHRAPHAGPLEIREVATQFNHMLDAIVAAQKRQLESEQRLRLAMEGSRLALWDFDLVVGQVYLSETWSELIGGPRQETVYRVNDLLAGVPPEDAKAAHDALIATVKGMTVDFSVEHRFVGAAGNLIWFLSQGRVTERDSRGRVTRMVGVCRDISERKATALEIERLAFYDSLTELPNRRLLMNRLAQAGLESRRRHQYFALLFVDLDSFKALNDTLGHAQGDALLREVALRLRACVRDSDTVARLGGDEFVVLLGDLGAETHQAAHHAEALGLKIGMALENTYHLLNATYRLTASIGITLFDGDDVDDINQPLRRADLAMFQAKADGRNTLRFYDREMNARLLARLELGNELRNAVAQSQFILHYQPQVTAEGRVIGVEALVRWEHPQRGIVSPVEFIPLAEDTGLILPLGRWVLEQACIQLVAWASVPELMHLTMAVNVSAIQLYQKDFTATVLEIVARTGVLPTRLKLELTEGVLLKNIEETIAKMRVLREIGIEFSLDDFGTGYSSLAYLKRLPIDQLKIDQTFVRDVLIDANDATIAKMVITLGQSLGLNVIAEGVEQAEQKSFLLKHGCRSYQGYLFSKPLPPDMLAVFVKEQFLVTDSST